MPSARTRHLAATLLAGGALTLTAACGGSASGSGSAPKVQLSLVAYSTPQVAYTEIIKAFQATPQGEGITFKQSYGASGDQSRAVAAGLTADVVAFALEPDISRLVKEDLVDAGWKSGPTKGMVTTSVVVIGTRKGNPKNLRTWTDLTKPGIEVITPNPFTSGGARWNVLAAYGAESDKGADDAKGMKYLNDLFHHVPVQDDSARKSLQTFTQGKGDAFLSYENEAIFAKKNNQPVDYTIPDRTLLIENPIAVTKQSKHAEQAKAFVDFVLSEPAQKIFAKNGYRPVLDGVEGADFPTPSGLFTIDDLGGWDKATPQFFDPEKGALVAVERELGVSVKK